MAELLTFEALAALMALTALEIVLGIDNIVFIAIVTGRLPEPRRPAARRLGLLLAMLMRIALLFAISWTMRLVSPLFEILGHAFTGKDLILLGGGLFLLVKATHEIHGQIEGAHQDGAGAGPPAAVVSFAGVIAQIGALDVIFSLDSVITAVGMTPHIAIMAAAVVIAVGIMIIFAGAVSRFVERHPTMKVLALSFLILVAVLLVAEGLGKHLDRGYVYFAMAFSLGVELLNLRVRKSRQAAAG